MAYPEVGQRDLHSPFYRSKFIFPIAIKEVTKVYYNVYMLDDDPTKGHLMHTMHLTFFKVTAANLI